MVFMHILCGLSAITAGFVALLARKGSPLHRKAGAVFFVSMLAMAGSAALLATFSAPDRAHVVASTLTIYLVCTGFLTVRHPIADARLRLAGLMLLGVAIGSYGLHLGLEAVATRSAMIDGERMQVALVFGSIALLAALSDVRLLIVGRMTPRYRVARHLWRMGLAMFIATASLFFGQPDFFPEPLEPFGLRAIPVLVVVAIPMIYLLGLGMRAAMRWMTSLPSSLETASRT